VATPTSIPSPSQGQAAGTLVEPTRTAGSNQGYWIPMEAVYATLAVFFALVIVALFVKKRKI
jgi:disulfide bond formation protein DsbB